MNTLSADYRSITPDVAARFDRIRQRPVILEVRGLKRSFRSSGGGEHTVDVSVGVIEVAS